MSIANNLEHIKNQIPPGVVLVAISKTKTAELISEAFEAGQIHFGENKVQEMIQKQEVLPKEILWHLVGHLQSNKVKYIAPFVYLIHSVDSLKLLLEIEKQAAKNHRIIHVLLQMHIAKEETKFGLDEEECMAILKSEEFDKCSHVWVRGLMGMSTNTENMETVKSEFAGLKKFFNRLQKDFAGHPNCTINVLSMGMSGDYLAAIEEGSTMVRVGSAIFGER